MCLENVMEVFKKLEVDVPDVVIDRAHRIDRPRIIRGKKFHQLFVPFTTWRHRTMVYRARKKLPKLKLDVTNRRIDLINKTSALLEEKKLGFAFADINCRLSMKIAGSFEYFENERDLVEIIRKYEEEVVRNS